MNGAGQLTILLGQMSKWQHLGDGFRGSRNRFDWAEAWPFLAAATALTAVIAAYVVYRRHHDFSQRTNEPTRLFRELCVAHQLNRTHRKLLWRLAEELGFTQPAQVFLMPAAFEQARLPPALTKHADAYAMLRERLF